MFKRVTVLVALAMFALAGTSLAQNPIEIGVDNGFVYSITSKLDDADVPDVTEISIPLMHWRFGFFLNENISVEPGLGFSYYKVGEEDGAGGYSWMDFMLTADVLYHFTTQGTTEFFVHGGGALMLMSEGNGESESTSQFGFGGGAGVKIPLVEAVKIRLGARALYLLENDKEEWPMPASLNIMGTVGISVMVQ